MPNRTRAINLPDPAISLLALASDRAPQILCSSSTPFAVDITSSDDVRIDRFHSFKNTIHSIYRSAPTTQEEPQYFLAADTDRYINVYSIHEKRLVRTLVAASGVTAVDVSTPPKDTPDFLRQPMLCAVTKEGTIELFPNPFAESKSVNGDLKSSRKNLTRKASASVRLVSPESKNKNVAVVAAFLQGPDLIVVSADGGVDLVFQKVRWQDEGNGELLFAGVKEVVKARSASTLNTATLNGVKDVRKTYVDESRTVVVNGRADGPAVVDAIEISSSESEEEEDDDEKSEDEASIKGEDKDPDKNNVSASDEADSDEEMPDVEASQPAAASQAEAEENVEPSFGDLIAARHPADIDISTAIATSSTTALTLPKANTLSLSSGMSLGTVLTQALRTNDTPLLEACLHTLDIGMVRATIERLDPTLAGLLLSKLAERLASRPGRYGNLITWVQWTCIAHGGAIASMPDVTAKIKTLYQVLNDRTRTLDDLLLLKGKLDLLEAQLQFRRSIAAQRSSTGKEVRDEPGVIYIEGQDNWDSEDDLDEDGARPSKRVKGARRDLDDLAIGESEDNEDEENEDDEDLPIANGANDLSSSSSNEDEDESDDEDKDSTPNGAHGALIDDEASVSDAEDSDPDDLGPSPAASDSSSATSNLDDEEDEGDENEEEDSGLDSFINDGDVDFDENAEDEIKVQGDDSDHEPEVEEPIPVKDATKIKKKAVV